MPATSLLTTLITLFTATLVLTACGSGAPQTSVDLSAAAGASKALSTPGDISPEAAAKSSDTDASAHVAGQGRALADSFEHNIFERPFSAIDPSVYLPQIDILQVEIAQSTEWIFGRLTLKDLSAAGATEAFVMEMDMNSDGRGDYLITSGRPANSSWWTTQNVGIYQDQDGSVGGADAIVADATPSSGNGFEAQLVNTDLAWARLKPGDTNTIEFAVSTSLFSQAEKYTVSMWAGNALVHPEVFNLNDRYTREQAGGDATSSPIREVDSTCHLVVGYAFSGLEPWACQAQ